MSKFAVLADHLFFLGVGHFQFPVHHCERQPAFDQIKRIAAELFKPPSRQDF